MPGITKGVSKTKTLIALSISENVHVITFARGHMTFYLYHQWHELLVETSLIGTAASGKVGYDTFPFPSVLTQSLSLFAETTDVAVLCPANCSTTLSAMLRFRPINTFLLFLAFRRREDFITNRMIWFTLICTIITILKFVSILRLQLEIQQLSCMSYHHNLIA